MNAALIAARAKVNTLTFGTPAWDSAMQIVRDLVAAEVDALPREEFCSIDSGIHRTRLMDGRVIGVAA
jgi:hypothetical protein